MPAEKFTLEQRIFMYDTYVKTGSCRDVCKRFLERFSGGSVPSRETVRKLVLRLRKTGSINATIPKRKRRVQTQQKLDEIGESLERSPNKSLRHVSQEVGVSKSLAYKAIKLLKLKPYRVSTVPELRPHDNLSRVNAIQLTALSNSSTLASTSTSHVDTISTMKLYDTEDSATAVGALTMGNERKRRKCATKTSDEFKEAENRERESSKKKPTPKKTRSSTETVKKKSSNSTIKEEVTHCNEILKVNPHVKKRPTRKSTNKRKKSNATLPSELEHSSNIKSNLDENSSNEFQDNIKKNRSENMQTPKHRQIRNAGAKSQTQSPDSRIVVNDNSSASEWEEVEEGVDATELDDYNPEIPKEGVEITINTRNFWLHKRRQRREIDIADIIRRQVNRFKKDIQVALHKVHLLCLLAHGQFLNSLLLEPDLLALVLSIIPPELHKRKSATPETVDKLVKWFCQHFQFDNQNQQWGTDVEDGLTKSLQECRVYCTRDYSSLFVLTLRALGYEARLCLSLHPLPLKSDTLLSKRKKLQKMKQETCNKKSECNVENSSSNDTKAETGVKKLKENCTKRPVRKRAAKSAKKSKVVMSSDSESDENRSDISENGKSMTSCKSKTAKNRRDLTDDDDDDDFVTTHRKEVNKFSFPVPDINKASTVKTKKKCPNRKILSSDDSDVVNTSTPAIAAGKRLAGVEYWIEVYAKDDGKLRWICVDCITHNIGDPHKIEKNFSEPITYVLAFDNDNCVKDVTKRYASKWMTHTRKIRVDEVWWEESLAPFLSRQCKRDKTENEHLDELMANTPMPTTIGEYKDHPLYVLKRHLLKFQAIYPPDAPPLGYIRNEAVYARECVHTLHSRETWLKQARIVRIEEVPYKIVKARPKWNKATGEIQNDLPLEVFGKWQTDEYVPPVAKGGKVPRNEYGNVELFQPCMLPIGTVHLQIPALNRVARKLNIDCCPALVGFDGNWGHVHPVFDGWIVCEEYKDVLIAAWEEEQENQQKREDEKREKRIYGNWKRLIKGLLIREKLKNKYDSKV